MTQISMPRFAITRNTSGASKNAPKQTKRASNPGPTESFSRSITEEKLGVITEEYVDEGWQGRLKNSALSAGALAAHIAAGAVLGPAGLLVVPTAISALTVAKAARNGGLKNLSTKGKLQVAASAVGVAALSTVVLSVGSIPAAFASGLAKFAVAGITGAISGVTESRRPVEVSAHDAHHKAEPGPAVTESYFSDGTKAMASW